MAEQNTDQSKPDSEKENTEQGAGTGRGGRGNKNKDMVQAVCIKKRQWKGRIIRPEDSEVFHFKDGIPKGYEDYFKLAD